MAGGLRRLLRIRAMQEELARMDMEAEAARLRALEALASEASAQALACRQRWFAAVERESVGAESKAGTGLERAGAEPERLAEEFAGEVAATRSLLIEARRPALMAQAERARAEFLDGRRERMTVESLVRSAAKLQGMEKERRAQRGLDDWYQGRLRSVENADRQSGMLRCGLPNSTNVDNELSGDDVAARGSGRRGSVPRENLLTGNGPPL